MFKVMFFSIFLLLFFSSASADFFMVSPLEEKLLDERIIEIGNVSSGETFEIIITDETNLGQDLRWTRFFASPQGLPEGWQVENPVAGEKRLVLKVIIPSEAPPNIYSVKVMAVNDEFGLEESFTARVRVKSDLLYTSVNNPGLNQVPFTGEKVVYNIVLRNDSIAPHSLKVFSTLPKNWSEEKEFTILPKETVNATITVNPLVEGKKDFKIIVYSLTAQKEISSFSSSLRVKPTLFGKLSAPANGFPFFTFSLGSFYYFYSFVFSFFK